MQFNKPTCEFQEKHLLLGTVPLNLTTIRTVHIENKGKCHAYFKVKSLALTVCFAGTFTIVCECGINNMVIIL